MNRDMSSIRLPADSFLAGALSALIFLPLLNYLLGHLGSWLTEQTGNDRWSIAPHPQLFTLLVAAIVFRLLVINYKREHTGRGWLMVTFLAAMAYAFWYYRFRHAG